MRKTFGWMLALAVWTHHPALFVRLGAGLAASSSGKGIAVAVHLVVTWDAWHQSHFCVAIDKG